MSDSLDKVYKMELGDHGVWVTFKSSTIVCLFDTEHMVKLLQVDYPLLLGQDLSPDSFHDMEYRIIVATPIGNQLWLGTGNATIRIFSIEAIVSSPEDCIQQIARHSQEIDTAAAAKTLQNRPLSDEGLVTAVTALATSPTSAAPPSLGSEIIPEEREGEGRGGGEGGGGEGRRGKRHRNTFGKTFRKHHAKKEPSVGSRKIESVYELKHLSSSRVLPDSLECTRVSILKPIKYKDQQFVISCVNSTNAVEKAVQLWQCSAASPTHWNYTCIPECYESVTKNLHIVSPNKSATTHYREKGRTYSTILGSLPT